MAEVMESGGYEEGYGVEGDELVGSTSLQPLCCILEERKGTDMVNREESRFLMVRRFWGNGSKLVAVRLFLWVGGSGREMGV